MNKKFTLNEHFMQTFVNYYPSSNLVFWNLCFQFLHLKFSLHGSLQQIGNIWSRKKIPGNGG